MKSTRDKVLVTGSSGLIGSAVIERFAQQFDVIGFDVKGPPHPPESADCIEMDISSDESVRQGLEQVRQRHGDRIASVIHLAAYYDFSGEPSPKYDEITVRGTKRLLHGLQSFRVEQFVFSSTMLVHAPCEPGQRINEDGPLDAKWDYPKSKVKTEELIRSLHGHMPYVLLRIAGVYDDACHSIPLANQMQRINERWLTSHVYPGDTSRGQAFIHLDDLVEAFWLLAERRAELSRALTLLLGESETLSYDELQRALGQLIHGEEWETRQIPKALAKTGAWLQDNLPLIEEPFIKPFMIDLADDHYELDISRARRLLGWAPRHSLRETLPRMVAALKEDPLGWYRDNKLQPPSELEEEAAQPAGKGAHGG
jgi:nucleoside-diphosphate-sugar epimerase